MSNENAMHRGEWLLNKVKEHGYTLELIADQIEVDRTTVWRWYKNKNLSYQKMKMVADVVGIDLRDSFPDSKDLYDTAPKNYEFLYLKQLERNKILEEELAYYKAKATEQPGQNRD